VHGSDEGEGAEEEQGGCRGQCDSERAVPEYLNGVVREVVEDKVDHELGTDQRGEGERVEQEGDQAEGAGAATKGEVEGGDEDLGERGDQLGEAEVGMTSARLAALMSSMTALPQPAAAAMR
jgi:hypothetical protein